MITNKVKPETETGSDLYFFLLYERVLYSTSTVEICYRTVANMGTSCDRAATVRYKLYSRYVILRSEFERHS